MGPDAPDDVMARREDAVVVVVSLSWVLVFVAFVVVVVVVFAFVFMIDLMKDNLLVDAPMCRRRRPEVWGALDDEDKEKKRRRKMAI